MKQEELQKLKAEHIKWARRVGKVTMTGKAVLKKVFMVKDMVCVQTEDQTWVVPIEAIEQFLSLGKTEWQYEDDGQEATARWELIEENLSYTDEEYRRIANLLKQVGKESNRLAKKLQGRHFTIYYDSDKGKTTLNDFDIVNARLFTSAMGEAAVRLCGYNEEQGMMWSSLCVLLKEGTVKQGTMTFELTQQ